MPFVTEAAWRSLASHLAEPGAEALIVAPYPQADAAWLDGAAEAEAQTVIDVVRAVRNIRAERSVEPARFVEAYVIADGGPRRALDGRRDLVEALARARPLHIVSQPSEAPHEAVATAVLEGAQVVLPMAGLFDLESERQRLSKLLAASQAEVERLAGRLANEEFLAKAPAAVVQREQEKLTAAQAQAAGLRQRLHELG
jgi:valyl-tRNA synthetase